MFLYYELIKANTQLVVCIGKKAGFLYKCRRTLQECTLHHTKATTSIGASVPSLMTIIDVSFECS
jgi:hypothetical protein